MAKDLKRKIVAEFSAQNKAKGEMASFRKDMDSTGQAMKNMAAGALASVGGLYALKRGFDYVTQAAMKQEDAVFLLEAALKAAGEYSESAMEGFEAFAASIQKATVYGDEEVLALMQLMKSLGVTSGALKQATKMAIGLAAATGRDVKSMSMYIALAQQGEFTMLRRFIPALRSTTDATEQLRIITEFAAEGFKIAEAQAETTSGAITKMWNAVSDLAEVAGKPFLEPMTESAGALTILLAGATAEIKKLQKAAEEAAKLRPKYEFRPMGFPRVPMPDLEAKFGKPEEPRELLAGQLADQTWAMKKLSEEYKIQKRIAEETATMEQHRMKMLEEGGTIQEMEWRRDTERIRLQMEAETEAKEKVAAEEIKIMEEMAARRDEFAMSFRNVIASGFEASMRDAENWKKHMINMLEEVYWAAIRMAFLEPFAGALAKGLTGAMGAVFGPGIFATPAPTTPTVRVAPMTGGGGPFKLYQHGGIISETGLAFMHKGEKVTPAGGGMGTMDVHIHNEGSEKLEISSVEEYMFGDQRIIDVGLQAMQHNMGYQNAIKSAARS